METHIGRDIPPYAILSHTWEDEEVTLQDWDSPARDRMKGFQKIRMTCSLAARHGIKYAWVDTCCIDKTNRAELSEAINSMYRWYKGAKVCYAYLSDLRLPQSAVLRGFMDLEGSTDPDISEPDDYRDLEPLLRKCRWFYRGWTLQELIAPQTVLFYQHDWRRVGNKTDWNLVLSDVTGITSDAVTQYNPVHYSIAERMSWAAGRETTREEDKAYCLLGIFDVNMPMLYGEGAKAFRRLQEEIIRTGYDVSIFAWTKPFPDISRVRRDGDRSCGAFANAPGEFHSIPARKLIGSQGNEVSITNAGVKLTLELRLVRMPRTGKLSYVLPIRNGGWQPRERRYAPALGVGLKKIDSGRFLRTNVEKLVVIPDASQEGLVRRIRCPDAYVLLDIPSEVPSDFFQEESYPSNFAFPQDCRVVKAQPSDKWNDADNSFMTAFDKEEYGILLVEVKVPTLAEDDDRTGEFMFLFSNCLSIEDHRNDHDLQYTIVGYREHQLILDIINLRIGAGDMDVGEMRRTLRNFAIPVQQTAFVPVEEVGQYIYISVEFVKTITGCRYTFKSSVVALEIKQRP
ncbi:het domain-containing protein [Colletotrichum camelliae]|nr:het domain-containing protein [Colletotrichum camelliae]